MTTLLHPPIAPWRVCHAEGIALTLLLRGELPLQAFARHLPDNEEELLPLRDEGADAHGWRRYTGLLPWDGGHDVTRYAFKLLLADGSQRWLAADGEHDRVPSENVHFRVNREHRPPAWVREQVFYQVFPDRFARGSDGPVQTPPDIEGQRANETLPWGHPVPLDKPTTVFYGGDLPGVEARLDYLQRELGITALYLNPIFASRSNHKYDTEDYNEVDAALGGNAALESLRRTTRERGVKLVLDAVVNHTGAQHAWFADPNEHSRYAFEADGRPVGWKGYTHLPVLDYAHPHVKAAMFEQPDSVMRRWMQPPYSIDGWRLDAVHMLGEGRGARNNAGLMREMRTAVKAQDPGAYLVGEHFNEATTWLQGDQEDGAMNYYGFAHPLRAWLAGLDLASQPVRLSTPAFAQWLREAMAAIPYENQLAQLNLLDSHDTPRFLTLLGGDIAAMKLAVTLLMTFPGTPCVYYGDEIGLEGGQDPDCRRCFPWEREAWNQDLHTHYREAIARRQRRRELRDGAFALLHAEGEVCAFARFNAEAASVVAANRGSDAVEIDLPVALPGKAATTVRLQLAPRSARVVEL
jgi:alpha-glucosidase